MLYTVGKIIELAFRRIWPFVIWSSVEEVMVKTLKTTQKPNSHAGKAQKTISRRPFTLAIYSFCVSCFHPPRRVVPSINTPMNY
jgi:hypothetical protein